MRVYLGIVARLRRLGLLPPVPPAPEPSAAPKPYVYAEHPDDTHLRQMTIRLFKLAPGVPPPHAEDGTYLWAEAEQTPQWQFCRQIAIEIMDGARRCRP